MTHLERAARRLHGVAHSHDNDFSVGLSLVFLAGSVLVMPQLSIGNALAALRAARIGLKLGGYVDRAQGAEIVEHIDGGAQTVFIDEPAEPAAMANRVTTLTHRSEYVAKGSKTVLVEGFNASRRGDETSCLGVVAEGSDTVLIGGESVNAPLAPARDDERTGGTAFEIYATLLWAAGYTSRPTGAIDASLQAASAVNDMGVMPDWVEHALNAEGTMSTAKNLTKWIRR